MNPYKVTRIYSGLFPAELHVALNSLVAMNHAAQGATLVQNPPTLNLGRPWDMLSPVKCSQSNTGPKPGLSLQKVWLSPLLLFLEALSNLAFQLGQKEGITWERIMQPWRLL